MSVEHERATLARSWESSDNAHSPRFGLARFDLEPNLVTQVGDKEAYLGLALTFRGQRRVDRRYGNEVFEGLKDEFAIDSNGQGWNPLTALMP
jgi:hypothetical protein